MPNLSAAGDEKFPLAALFPAFEHLNVPNLDTDAVGKDRSQDQIA